MKTFSYRRFVVRFSFITAYIITMALVGIPAIQAADPITIYGSKGCSYCEKMTQWLDENKIPYVFKDVITNDAASNEMSEVVQNANYKTRFYFPVMVIKGQVVMRPSTDNVKKALDGGIVKGMEEREYKDPSWRMSYPKSMKYSYEDIRSRVRDGDVTIYDDNSAAGKKIDEGPCRRKSTLYVYRNKKTQSRFYPIARAAGQSRFQFSDRAAGSQGKG